MERHVQTILAGLCTAGIVAIATIAWSMSAEVAQQSAKMDAVVTTISELKSDVDAINERFRLYIPREEADAKLASLKERDQDYARRIERLEHREGL